EPGGGTLADRARVLREELGSWTRARGARGSPETDGAASRWLSRLGSGESLEPSQRSAAADAIARAVSAMAGSGSEGAEWIGWGHALVALLRRSPAPRRPRDAARLAKLAARAEAFAYGMDFGFLYDRVRRVFSIGFRMADLEGPGRLDLSYYDLLASEARL